MEKVCFLWISNGMMIGNMKAIVREKRIKNMNGKEESPSTVKLDNKPTASMN